GGITFNQTGGGAVTFTTVSTNNGTISLQDTGGNLTVGTNVASGGNQNVTLQTVTSGNIVLTGTTNAGAGTATLTSAGNIEGAGTLTAGTASLTAATGIGDSTALNLVAASVNAANTSSGNIVLNDSLGSLVTVTSLTAAGTGGITFNQTG